MNDATLDAIADERDRAELEAMQAKAETAEWVSAYDRELVRRKAAEARLTRVEALAEKGPFLHRWIDDSRLVDLADLRAALSEQP